MVVVDGTADDMLLEEIDVFPLLVIIEGGIA